MLIFEQSAIFLEISKVQVYFWRLCPSKTPYILLKKKDTLHFAKKKTPYIDGRKECYIIKRWFIMRTDLNFEFGSDMYSKKKSYQK
jgi:hypothetical protein